jgi:hypothetical protein
VEPFVVLAAFAFILCATVWLSRELYKGNVAQLRAFMGKSLDDGARLVVDTGWTPSLRNTSLTGTYEGHMLSISFEIRGSGKSKKTYTQLGLRVPNSVASFSVGHVGVLNRLGRWLGVVPDVKTGHEGIDDKFILRGQEGSLKTLFRSRELERAIDALFGGEGVGKVALEGGWLRCERAQTLDAGSYATVFRALLRIARECERKEVVVKILGEKPRFAWTAGSGTARCPYCRDDVGLDGDDIMACGGCDTVHHSACYDEAGGCTIFGCDRKARGRVDA